MLNFGASYAFLYWGLEKVKPGMTQVILALVPLFTLLFAILHRQETFRWNAMLGAFLALGGVAIVFREQLQENVPIFSLLAVMLGSVCIAESSVIAKSFPKNHPITTNAIGMITGAIILYSMSLIWKEPHFLPAKNSHMDRFDLSYSHRVMHGLHTILIHIKTLVGVHFFIPIRPASFCHPHCFCMAHAREIESGAPGWCSPCVIGSLFWSIIFSEKTIACSNLNSVVRADIYDKFISVQTVKLDILIYLCNLPV